MLRKRVRKAEEERYMTNDSIHTFTYQFYGDDGLLKMQDVMKMLRHGLKKVGGLEVESIQEHSRQIDGDITSDRVKAPYLDALEYCLAGGLHVFIRSFTGETGFDMKAEPQLELEISVAGGNDDDAAAVEARIRKDLESIIYMDHGMGYCCE